jgi:hypothetical protein
VGAPSFDVAPAVVLLAEGSGAVVLLPASEGSALIPLAVDGLSVEALLSNVFVASVVDVAGTPSCFLRLDPIALVPREGATLLVPVGATGYFDSSSFFKGGFTGAIFVGPVAGAVVVG